MAWPAQGMRPIAVTDEGPILAEAATRPMVTRQPSPLVEGLDLEAHDHQQLEVQLAQSFGPTDAPTEPLTVELFLFVPRNVGVNAENYRREIFYGDVTSYLRVDLPSLTLEDLARDDDGSPSPLAGLGRRVGAVARGQGPAGPVAVAVKLFGHAFKKSLTERFGELTRLLAELPSQPVAARWSFLDEADRSAEAARRALAVLRRARRRFEPLGHCAPSTLDVFHLTDEYSSLLLDQRLAALAAAASSMTELYDGSGFVGRLSQTLARHARVEASFRAEAGYLNLATDEEPRPGAPFAANREYFAYRQSFLKKAVQQALYVDTRRLASDDFWRNATAAVAAGLAATWWLVWTLPSFMQHLSYSTPSLVLAIFVAAYMVKDRIKVVLGGWLTRRLLAFDAARALEAGSLAEAGLGSLQGNVRERFDFIDPTEVPPDVLTVRSAARTLRGLAVGGEGVIAYRRRLELEDRSESSLPTGMALRQIIRLNLRHFLTRLDEPSHEEPHWSTSEQRFLRAALPKVYHLNLVARIVGEKGRLFGDIRRWRVVINKHGIVRIETVR